MFHKCQTPPSLQSVGDELSAAINEVSKPAPKPPTPTKPAPKPVPRVAKTNIGYDATIITDTKSKEFSPIASSFKSLIQWFKKLTKKKKQVPKYTVTETSRRRGVIQQATSKSGAIFTADNESIKEQIRLRRQKEAEAHESTTSWSPYTEPGYNLLEEHIQNVTVEFKKQSQPEAVPEQKPVVSEDNSDEARWSSKPTPVAAPKRKIKPVVENPVIPAPEKVEPTPEPEEVATPPVVPDPTPEPLPPKKIKREQKGRSLDFEIKQETNTLTVVVMMVVIGLLVLLFVGKTLYDGLTAQEEAFVPTPVVQPLFTNTELSGLALAEDSQSLEDLINTQAKTTGINTEIYVSAESGGELQAVNVFGQITSTAPVALGSEFNTIRFFSVDQSLALVLTFSDSENVRGGMLQWEQTMAADMQKVLSYGQYVNRFEDMSVNGVDVRVVRDVEGNEILAYGFIDERYLVITTDSWTFAALVTEHIIQ